MIKSNFHRNYQYFKIYKAILKTPDVIKLQSEIHLLAVVNGKQNNDDGSDFDVAITKSLNRKPISEMSKNFDELKNVTNSRTKRRIYDDSNLTENSKEIDPEKTDFDVARKHISEMSQKFDDLKNSRTRIYDDKPTLTETSKEIDPARIRQVLADGGLDSKKHQRPKTYQQKVPKLEVFLENPAAFQFFANYNEIIERKPFDFDERSDRFDTNNLNFVLMNASVSK